MLPIRALFVFFPVNQRQWREGHYAKRGGSLRQARGVITPSAGGHYANVNERQSCPMVTHWSRLKSIDPEEGGHYANQRGGAPPRLGVMGRVGRRSTVPTGRAALYTDAFLTSPS